MKKLITINLVLILFIYIVPLKTKEIKMTEETSNQEEVVEVQEKPKPIEIPIDITHRHMKKTSLKPNLKLDVNTDLRQLSNLKAKDYDKMLEGTKLSGLGKALEEVETKHKINGLYIMGLACLESSYGNSRYARERNNLVGYNAVDSNPNKATYFKSKSECIDFVSGKLKKNYLSESGKYFEGYSARAIDIHYCTDQYHADKIIKIVNKLEKKL